MLPADSDTSTASQDAAADVLHMDVQAHEDDAMAALGYALERRSSAKAAHLAVSPRVSTAVASESVKMLFAFTSLRQLQLRFDFDDCAITQQMVCAIAELLQLTSLQVLHGSLQPDVDVSHWSSLRSLAELKLLPGEQAGVRGLQIEQLTGLSSLTSLALRPHPETSSDNVWHLASMNHLQELSLCPLPEACTLQDLQQLLHMPRLTRLQLGTSNAEQVLMLTDVKLPPTAPQLSLLVKDACEPGPAADVLTVISWTLPQFLTALSIGPLAAPHPNDVLVTLATLTNLQSLQLQLVAPPGQHVSGTVELLSLSPCQKLTSLEVLTSSRLYFPFTLKTVSLATLAWPDLAALRLSLAGKLEMMPEALDMCDNFKKLSELVLMSPLQDSPCLEDLQATSSIDEDTAAAGARGSGGWTGWATASLGSLGLFGGRGSSGAGAAAAAANSSSGAGGARRSSTERPGASGSLSQGGSGGSISSPLAHHVHQRELVQQSHWKQHEAAHAHSAPGQHIAASAAAHSSHQLPCSTLQDKQLLPPAVRSLQQHKLMRADSVFGGSSVCSQDGGGPDNSLDGQGGSQQSWSPRWLLRSFVPFGSPVSTPSALSAAGDSPTGGQHSASSWGLLDTCRVAMPRTTSLGSGQHEQQQQQPGATSRLQYSSSSAAGSASPVAAAGGAMRRTATVSGASGELLAKTAQQHMRASGPSAVAAPGRDLAMYRAAGKLLPLNLNYLPNSLTKLCLQAYHLVAIGMPEPPAAQAISNVPTGLNTATSTAAEEQQPQQQDARMQESGAAQEQQQQQQEEQGLVKQPSAESTPDSIRTSDQQAYDDSTSIAAEGEQEGGQPEGSVGVAASVGAAAEGSDNDTAALTVTAKPLACSTGGAIVTSSVSAGGASLGEPLARKVLPQLPLPHLLYLELDGCRIDDDTMTALLKSSPALRGLEIAGLEGLTDVGLAEVSSLQHLTRLCVEAEDTLGVTLASLSAVRRLRHLKKLHWCSRDCLHGALDTDLLTAQLSGLTGLRQLVLLVSPDSEAAQRSGWMVMLQRRLPLCRLVLRRELLVVDGWGDTPSEDA